MSIYGQYSQQPWRQKNPVDSLNWQAPANVYVRRARARLGLDPLCPATREEILKLPRANQIEIVRVQWLAKLKPEPKPRPWWFYLAMVAIGYLSLVGKEKK